MTLSVPRVVVDYRHKAFPSAYEGSDTATLVGRLNVLSCNYPTPVVVVRSNALDHNIRTLQGLCDRSGMSLAPHVKTTMSPEVASAQLAAGAWGITLATPSQVRIFRRLGANRIILANEVVDPAAIEWLHREMAQDADFFCFSYVDSTDGIELLEKTLSRAGLRRPLPVIIEIGVPGGRAGVRDLRLVAELAERTSGSAYLNLAGVGGFEGVVQGPLDGRLLADVRKYLRELRAAADAAIPHHSCEAEPFIVTVGGSCFIEMIATELGQRWRTKRGVRVVLRSGCYVTHDSLGYARYRELLHTEYRLVDLKPALRLWSRVLARPEPGLAIMDFGKRDTGVDAGFPVPELRLRRDGVEPGEIEPSEIVAVNDQHAYLRTRSGSALDLDIGDRVGFGVSHPCTTFDKWQVIPVVDDRHVLTGVLQTFF
ncbi:alanine racemase [Amycolatopsis thermoflava]|uniref:alanine racemase n=1 Tax=Amycolatopsis thermoflava TaxID=84480 RepID=UPI003F4A8010